MRIVNQALIGFELTADTVVLCGMRDLTVIQDLFATLASGVRSVEGPLIIFKAV